MKEKKHLQPDKAIFNKLRLSAEKLLKKSLLNVDTDYNDLVYLLNQLRQNLTDAEFQNQALYFAKAELEEQQAKLTNIYDLAPIGYVILNKAGMVEEVNNTGINLLQCKKAELVDARFKNFVAADCSDSFQLFFKKLLRTRSKQTCQVRVISKAGQDFYAQLEGIAIYTAADAVVRCYIAFIDTTERIKAEQHLAETKDRLELAMEAAAAGTWELDLVTMAFYLHEFNYHLCAVKQNQFDGRYETFINLVHPADRDMVNQSFKTAIAQQKELDLVCRFINANGKLCYASIRGHVITEPGPNKRLVGILMDITEKKLNEEETAQLKKDQQKNITAASLTAGENERKRISEALHDSVSQLLYGIKMQLDQLNLEQQPKTPINHIYSLLDTTVQEIRNISFQLAPSILTDFGLPTTITELAQRLSTPQLEIKTHITGFTQRLDLFLESCIFRIIQELINNCMKHSGASVIDLSISKTDVIEIILKDNGKGFNVQLQETKPTGSGFSSIKNRLGLYNGSLNIQSISGGGTTVCVNLAIC